MIASYRIAILGLYNSGSTAVAGALHRLGVHMGEPFWYSSDEHAANNFYEPWDLACQLRFWWNEPDIREHTPRHIRIACLANWVRLRQCYYRSAVGAKHPLLCLCGCSQRERARIRGAGIDAKKDKVYILSISLLTIF